MKHTLVPAVATMALALAACTTPPITTPSTAFSVTMGQLCPQCPDSFPVAQLPTGLPPFQVDASQGGIAIQVPAEAKSVTLSSATLHLQFQNQMKVPLTMALSLSKDNAYGAGADSLGTVSLDPGAVQTLNSPFDPTLLQNPTVYAGVVVTIGSTGGLGLTTINKTDAVNATTSATVQIKLF